MWWLACVHTGIHDSGRTHEWQKQLIAYSCYSIAIAPIVIVRAGKCAFPLKTSKLCLFLANWYCPTLLSQGPKCRIFVAFSSTSCNAFRHSSLMISSTYHILFLLLVPVTCIRWDITLQHYIMEQNVGSWWPWAPSPAIEGGPCSFFEFALLWMFLRIYSKMFASHFLLWNLVLGSEWWSICLGKGPKLSL